MIEEKTTPNKFSKWLWLSITLLVFGVSTSLGILAI